MFLTDHLALPSVRVPLDGRDRRGVIRELAGVLATAEGGSAAEIARAVEEREEILGTGIGHGVAMPHARTAAMPRLAVAAGLAAAPLDFNALDGEPVRLVFLIAGPVHEAGAHVRLLSRITRLVRQRPVRAQLFGASSAAEFHRALLVAEER